MKMAGNWTNNQKWAINAEGSSTLVAAAAGSGKTAVLVERIIRKITDSKNPVDIDRLIVVTFTRAAALEMKQRIRNELDKRIIKEPLNDRLQTQLALINNAQITTIDSFCLNIIRNYFADIDIDPGFRTADEGEVKLLENDVMADMLEEYYAKGDEAFYGLVDAYAAGRDDSKIVELILKIYRFARSCAWEDEWYDKCLDVYNVENTGDLDGNVAAVYIMQEIKQSLTDYDVMYDELERICTDIDGPSAYMPAIISDHEYIKRLLRTDSFEELIRLVGILSFDTLGRGGKKDVSEEKREYVKGIRNSYKDYINKTVKGKLLIKSANRLAEDIINNRQAIAMFIKLAQDFSGRMQEEKRNRNIIDFNDMEHLALNVLIKRENGRSIYTQAADSLSDFYEEILIDEYQDSNMLQEIILNAVSKNRDNPAVNNVYMVGDVKQSIYKFRLACPELFIQKYNSYCKKESQAADEKQGLRIELQTNFRSRENVLESANDVFSRLMNPKYCGIAYGEPERLNTGFEYPKAPETVISDNQKSEAVDFGLDMSTDIYIVENNADDSEGVTTVEAEALKTAEIIKNMISPKDGRKYLVYDKDTDGGYRTIKYSDIVVLTRTVSGWADVFVNTLLSEGIPAYSDSSEGYFGVREIQLILSYLKVIDNPLQDIPLTAVMLSYFGRLDTEELALIRAEDKKKPLYKQLCDLVSEDGGDSALCADSASSSESAVCVDSVSSSESALCADSASGAERASCGGSFAPARKKVVDFLNKLEIFREKSELQSIYDLLWDILYDTGYYDYVGTMPAGKRRQANLDILLEKAAAFESTSYNGLFNFLRYIERLQKFDVDFGEASLLGENENLVRVMSIHKSKGLEFPVVILAGMSKKMNKRDAAGELVIDNELGIGVNVVSVEKRTKNTTLVKSAISRKIIRESISEEMRVLYVAMTRAREKLIMLGTLKADDKVRDKWKIKSEYLKNGADMYSFVDISSMDSYFDMVMPVVYMDTECSGINKGSFKVLECKLRDSQHKADEGESELPEADLLQSGQSAQCSDREINDICDSEDYNEYEKFAALEYPYPIDERKKVKVTVSELKRMQYESDFEQVKLFDEAADARGEEEELKPQFLSGKETQLIGNERGNAYHRIMECLDYEMLNKSIGDVSGKNFDEMNRLCTENIKQQLSDMLESEKINRQQADCIKIKDIVKFCLSDIGFEVRQAALEKRLFREQPFVFIYESFDPDQLIQGIIDLYLVKDGKIKLVDYKTDRVARGIEGEEELKKRYAVQLDYYARALNQITGLEVEQKIIYSFALGKEICIM